MIYAGFCGKPQNSLPAHLKLSRGTFFWVPPLLASGVPFFCCFGTSFLLVLLGWITPGVGILVSFIGQTRSWSHLTDFCLSLLHLVEG